MSPLAPLNGCLPISNLSFLGVCPRRTYLVHLTYEWNMDMMSILVGVLAGLVVGGILVFAVLNAAMKKRSGGILKEAEVQAEALKKEKILQAKEKFLQLKEQHEKEVRERERTVQQAQEKTKQREQQLSRQQQDLSNKEKSMDRLKEDMEQKISGLDRRREETEKMHAKQVNLLENISGPECRGSQETNGGLPEG
jgi:ribonuclease Y